MKKLQGFLKKASFTVGLYFVMAQFAFAADAGDAGAMPWEGPLQKVMDSISGPVAKILGVIVIVIAGLGIAFGEAGSGVRKLFQVVMGLAIAFSAASIVATLYNPSAGLSF